MSDSVQPHRRQPTRLRRPWDSPGKNTGVGCHILLQCTKVESESEVAQMYPTLSDPMECSLPGSSVQGIFWHLIQGSNPQLLCLLHWQAGSLPLEPPAAAAKSLQSCLTLCNPIDGSPPGSPAPGILQARTLEWVAISFSNA